MHKTLDPWINIGLNKTDRGYFHQVRLINLFTLYCIAGTLILSMTIAIAFNHYQAASIVLIYVLLYPVCLLLNYEGLRTLSVIWALIIFSCQLTTFTLVIFPRAIHTEVLFLLIPLLCSFLLNSYRFITQMVVVTFTLAAIFFINTHQAEPLLNVSVTPALALLTAVLVVLGTTQFLAFYRDESKAESEHILDAQTRDAMTGLNNYEEIYRQISKSMDIAGNTVVVMVVDIDNFKAINNEYGWDTGNAVLKDLSLLLKPHNESSHMSIGRLQSDTFAIVLSKAGLNDALVLAEAIKSNIRTRSLLLNNGAIKYSASIGISIREKVAGEAYQLIDSARLAVKNTKKSGKGNISVATPPPPPPLHD
ncbi:GGDEF domain-containing protein [Veronia pacifica]|uniref:GGDEF domain-containing protein n=1 Tax=Veronia pacifica TaxID=1080227 RepID=A0A1C3EFM0_9GAMM|nr:GGDEF domain-containing protein [Veronia pacifica]ODA32021.1 hypothetical protein A8L45_14505 [Veronia pacifica]